MRSSAVILAAGVGSRLRPLTDDRPKCLIEVGGRTLLDRLVSSFSRIATDVTVVTGYRSDKVSDALAGVDFGLPVRLAENREFASTNSMFSAFVARDFWRGSDKVYFSNSDVVIKPSAIANLSLEEAEHVALVVSKVCDEEDMKVRLHPSDGAVVEVSKQMPITVAHGEFTGVYCASGSGVAAFFGELERLLSDQDMVRKGWYDLVVDQLARKVPVRPSMLSESDYAEVDTLEDLAAARLLVGEWCETG